MFGILASFQHEAELRACKDELLVAEIVRAMARQGSPASGSRRKRIGSGCRPALRERLRTYKR